MNPCEHTDAQILSNDFLQTMSIICYLMTCYSMKPCQHLAQHIDSHLNILLNSSMSEQLGNWQPAFFQLQCKWRSIADHHIRNNKNALKAQQSINLH